MRSSRKCRRRERSPTPGKMLKRNRNEEEKNSGGSDTARFAIRHSGGSDDPAANSSAQEAASEISGSAAWNNAEYLENCFLYNCHLTVWSTKRRNRQPVDCLRHRFPAADHTEPRLHGRRRRVARPRQDLDLLAHSFLKRRVPSVLDLRIGPTWEESRDLGPLVAEDRVLFGQDSIFEAGPRVSVDCRIQLIVPSLATLLRAAIGETGG